MSNDIMEKLKRWLSRGWGRTIQIPTYLYLQSLLSHWQRAVLNCSHAQCHIHLAADIGTAFWFPPYLSLSLSACASLVTLFIALKFAQSAQCDLFCEACCSPSLQWWISGLATGSFVCVPQKKKTTKLCWFCKPKLCCSKKLELCALYPFPYIAIKTVTVLAWNIN